MATSFDPKLGSSSGRNPRTLNTHRNFFKSESVVIMNTYGYCCLLMGALTALITAARCNQLVLMYVVWEQIRFAEKLVCEHTHTIIQIYEGHYVFYV
jgi:hypothetical protein